MMSKPILFILHLPPPVHGAAMVGKYIQDSKVINEAFDCHYINLTTASSLEDIGRGGVKKLWRYIKLLLLIKREVKRLKPQLVYITPNACGGAFYKDFVVVQMLKGMGCKVVAHYHNKGVATRQDRWLDDKLYRRFFNNLKVILLADVLYNDVKKYVKREDVFICPNGIPESIDCEPTVERNNAVPHLLFLSNLLVSKGVLVLLDALKILKERGCSFICDFVGGETAEINATRFENEIKQRGLNSVVVYLGRKYGEDKAECFKQSDVFVFPTFYNNETFGLVNLEAMEYKLPVIATNEGGIPDVVKDGENGLLCEKQNADDLANKIECLLSNKELRERMGEDGYRKFKQQFTLDSFERKFKDTVSAIIGGKILILRCFTAQYRGRRYDKAKEEFFKNADIFVFPTSYPNECFPLVLLEAMQHGIPCVTTPEAAIADIVKDGETGLLCEKQDAQSLCDCLERLINDKTLCLYMGDEGRKRYKENFTLDRFEERLKTILYKTITS